MKKAIFTIVFMMVTLMASAMQTKFFSVDFDKMELTQDGQEYELVQVNNKVVKNGREVTYFCIDKDLHAVAFRLLVNAKGEFVDFQKCVSNK